VHQSSLLKAVRTVYNIFLLSTDPVNQTVAQGGLTQIVNHVFARCKIPDASPGSMEGFPPRHDEPELPNLPQTPISIARLPSVTMPTMSTDHQDTQEFSSLSANQQLTETSSTHVPSEIPTLEAALDDHSASEQDSGEPPNM
jgi:brefeldin A-inhibited guanine nucleotide-exchange protein